MTIAELPKELVALFEQKFALTKKQLDLLAEKFANRIIPKKRVLPSTN